MSNSRRQHVTTESLNSAHRSGRVSFFSALPRAIGNREEEENRRHVDDGNRHHKQQRGHPLRDCERNARQPFSWQTTEATAAAAASGAEATTAAAEKTPDEFQNAKCRKREINTNLLIYRTSQFKASVSLSSKERQSERLLLPLTHSHSRKTTCRTKH